MTKSELVETVFEKTSELTKNQVAVIVESIFDGMKEALQRNERVEIRRFGNFTLKDMKERAGRNPRTGEQVTVPAKKKIHFKVGKPFHDLLNPADKPERL